MVVVVVVLTAAAAAAAVVCWARVQFAFVAGMKLESERMGIPVSYGVCDSVVCVEM